MISFKNCNIYLNNDKIVKSDLLINKNKFSGTKVKDGITLNNKYIIVPGFIEEHIHGANGSDVMNATSDDLANIASSITQSGTTSFLATTMTMDKVSINKALVNIASKKHEDNEAKILGVHLEGPFISEIYKGAQDKKYILKPNVKDMKGFIKSSKGLIKLITIAPEECKVDFLKFLKKNKIIMSAGHSNASFDDIKNNLDYISCTTHTFNAMSKLHHRDIGLVGAALTLNRLYSELILDLEHTNEEAAKLLFNSKGKDKLILITDSMEARFKKSGTYHLGTYPVYVKNNRAELKDGTLAGSILEMNIALRNAKKLFNLSIEDTVNLASRNVKDNLKLKGVGEIKIGNFADFVIIDKDFNVYQTYVNGKLVYSKPKFKL